MIFPWNSGTRLRWLMYIHVHVVVAFLYSHYVDFVCCFAYFYPIRCQVYTAHKLQPRSHFRMWSLPRAQAY